MDTTQPRSRRSILTASLGAAGGALAASLGRPLGVNATVTPMELGTVNNPDATTRIVSGINGVTLAIAGPGIQDYDFTEELVAIAASRGSGPALSVTYSDNAVMGTGIKVRALATDGVGIDVDAGKEGVIARVHEEFGSGVFGSAEGDEAVGVWGDGLGYGTVAVQGNSLGAAGSAVRGLASGTGTGGEFRSEHGTALKVSGPAHFSRSGRALVPKGRSYVDITIPGGLSSSTSTVLATIQTYRSGVGVAGVRLNYPSTGKARIYLTKVGSTTATTPVGWMVID